MTVSSFWNGHVFAVADVVFDWVDAALAAMARGEWRDFERRLAEGLASAARAESETTPPSPEALESAQTSFRYDRELISAADANAWLDHVGLSADEWVDYLSRDLLRVQWADELDATLDRFPPSPEQLTAAAVSEGICSGTFDRFQRALARRAAMVFGSDEQAFRQVFSHDPAPAALEPAIVRVQQTYARWLPLWPEIDVRARLSIVMQLDALFTELIERVASNGRMTEALEANRLEWMRLELESVAFPSEAAAHEALLCMKEDCQSLSEVAALAKLEPDHRTVTLSEVDPRLREQLMGAEPGQVTTPLSVDDRFQVTRLISRMPPSLDDPQVAAQARQALIDQAVQIALRDHVRPG